MRPVSIKQDILGQLSLSYDSNIAFGISIQEGHLEFPLEKSEISSVGPNIAYG